MRQSLLLLVLMLLLASCSSSSQDDEMTLNEALRGSWQRFLPIDQNLGRLAFEDGGVLTVLYANLQLEGAYRFDSGGLLIVEDEGCGTFLGTYATTFEETDSSRTLTLEQIDDDCQIRAARWPGVWTWIEMN